MSATELAEHFKRLAQASRLFAREFLTPSVQEWPSSGHDWPTLRGLFGALLAE